MVVIMIVIKDFKENLHLVVIKKRYTFFGGLASLAKPRKLLTIVTSIRKKKFILVNVKKKEKN